MTGATLADQAGLQALTGDQAALLRAVDGVFESWGTESGAESMIPPSLLPVESLARLDFYENFPHQALVAAPLDLTKREPGTVPAEFPPQALEPAGLALPSAACFAVYLHHAGRQLPGGTTVTLLGRCFRREERYDGLRRLLGFHMREIVALGSREHAQRHLDEYGQRIEAFTGALGLRVHKQAATDPFYDRGGQRALLQRLSPVKHEFQVGDLAIASLNIHRNFFGERCDITLAGEPVFTSCVAFGLERWLAVLRDRFGTWQDATRAVADAANAVAEATPPVAEEPTDES